MTPFLSHTHDANGNTVSKTVGAETRTYRYDVENRLSGIDSSANSTSTTYYYDPFGRRLFKDIGGVRTYFLYTVLMTTNIEPLRDNANGATP